MKREAIATIAGLVVCAAALVAFAGGHRVDVEDTYTGVIATNTTSALTGYIESISVDVAAYSTQNVQVVTDDGLITILSVSAVAADATYRPRVPTQSIAGADLGTSNHYEKIYVEAERLRCIVTGGSVPTNDVTFRIRVKR